MSDTSSPTTPPPAESVPRTTTGEIKDQSPTTLLAEPETPKPTEGDKPKDDKSLLNEETPEDKKAPDKYDFKLPDGAAVDEKVMDEAKGIFKDLGLNNKDAQRLVDFYVARTQEVAEAPHKLWNDTQRAWQDEVKADKELGGKLPEVRSTVARAIDGLGDPKLAADFRKAMDITGAGNNPAFVKAFYRLAQQVTEGKAVTGNGPAATGQAAPDARPRTSASAIYPNLP